MAHENINGERIIVVDYSRARRILEIVENVIFEHQSHIILSGVRAAKELLSGDEKEANDFDKLYKPFNWEGDCPPVAFVYERYVKTMYRNRIKTIKTSEKLECECHVCKGTNTVDLPVETDMNGHKVSYVACMDCEMITGDC